MSNEVTNRFLENITIASPCHVNWDEMTGDEATRFCNQCEKSVYNLSEMSRDDAERFMIEKEGRVCIRMYLRHDGTVITDDCPVGLRKVKRALQAARKQMLKTAAACAAVISSAFFGDIANAQQPAKEPAPAAPQKAAEQKPDQARPLMGEPCVPQLTPAQAEAEKSISAQVSAAIIAGVSKKEQPKIGTLQFFVTTGKLDRVAMAVSTGDKKLDDKIVAIAKGIKLKQPSEALPQWKSILINFTDTK